MDPRGRRAACRAGVAAARQGARDDAGRFAVAIEDLRAVAPCTLRHRLGLSYEAEADRVDADAVIAHLLASVPLEAA
ncbi:MAG: hypothetical protein ACKPEA_05675 [Planctomycetota bacterium]